MAPGSPTSVAVQDDVASSLYTAVPLEEDDEKKPVIKRPNWFFRLLLDTWIPEALAIAFSCSCIIAIIAVLYAYDGIAAPRMPYGITLNAITSILSTASRSMMVYTVAASISQLKWCWYHQRTRKLYDIQTFDAASRGPMGAAFMLASLGLRPLASLGAAVTILALAFDPFVQQVLSYRSIPSPDRARFFRPFVLSSPSYSEDPSSDSWRNAINVGIWSGPKQIDVQPSCATGTCTWSPYRSMGWCSKCQDAMSYAKITNCTFHPSGLDAGYPDYQSLDRTDACTVNFGSGKLPYQVLRPFETSLRGAGVTGGQEDSYVGRPAHRRLDSSSDADGDQDSSVGVYNPLLAREAVWDIAGPSWYKSDDTYRIRNSTFLGILNPVIALGRVTIKQCDSAGLCIAAAEECAVSMCDMVLESSVTNGTIDTKVLEQDFGFMTLAYPDDKGTEQEYISSCWQPSNISAASLQQTALCLNGLRSSIGATPSHNWDVVPLISYKSTLADILVGNGAQTMKGWSSKPLNYSSTAVQRIAANGLQQTLEGVAVSLTSLGLTASTTIHIDGEALSTETFVVVVWSWLALPILLVVSAAILLLISAVQSRRCGVQLWKVSVLPFLYHGLEPDYLATQATPGEVSMMGSVSEAAKVQMGNVPGRQGVVLVRRQAVGQAQ